MCSPLLSVASLIVLQVTVTPRTVTPADIVRFAVQVANPLDAAVVTVKVDVPEALAILGADAPAGWTVRVVAATDSTPQAITWSGGQLARQEFREFAFLARPGATAQRASLVFPVELVRADGSTRAWRQGGEGVAPVVQIQGSVGITAAGAFAVAAAGVGLATLALALTMRRR